jgi:hypothetical protein
MMENKPVLHFSQSNLQDFKECPRRFQLKVLDQISWPAAYLEPLSRLEQATELGNKFHQLCHQYFSGIDPSALKNNISNPDLRIMWENFFDFGINIQSEKRYSEIILSTPFLNHHLIAKYDLVLQTPDSKYIIFDWKTSPRKPSRTMLSQRFQTILYPFIFARAGKSIFKTEHISPDEISLNYWYPMSSDPEEIFPYSTSMHSDNLDVLTVVITKIDDLIDSGEIFPLTDDIENCSKCIYRSLCERGVRAGEIDIFTEIDQEDLSNVHFDLDNISGIEF